MSSTRHESTGQSNRHLWVSLTCGTISVVSFLTYRKIEQLKRRKRKLPFPDIPYTVPDPHWLTGHLSLLGHDVTQGQKRLAVDFAGTEYGISTFFTFSKPVLSVLNAQLVNRILRQTSNRKGHKTVIKHFKHLFGQNTILMMVGKEWKANREIIVKSLKYFNTTESCANTTAGRLFLQSILRGAVRVEQGIMRQLENNVDTKQLKMDIVTLCRMSTLDVFGLVGFGYDFECFAEDHSANQPSLGKRIFELTCYLQQDCTRRCYHDRYSLSAQYYWIPTQQNRKHRRAVSELNQILKSIIVKRRNELQNRAQGGNAMDDEKPDLVVNLLRATSTNEWDGSGLTPSINDDYLSDWLITALFGGYDTSSIAMAYTLYLLTKNPKCQEECAKEARRVLHGKTINDDIAVLDAQEDLPYITACFWEALRFYPPTT